MQKAVGKDDEFRKKFNEAFEKMAGEFRRDVIVTEERLARAVNREQRRTQEARLALACNQLAWLLGKCESNPDEAVTLSRRSLELEPNNPMYLDTLGRAYFSAGKISQAIAAQRRAVERSPFDRQMANQLEEFQQAQGSAKN